MFCRSTWQFDPNSSFLINLMTSFAIILISGEWDNEVLDEWYEKSRRMIVTLSSKWIIVRWGYTSSYIFTLKWILHLGNAFTLTYLHICHIGYRWFNLDLSLKIGLKSFKSNHNNSNIIQCFLIKCQFHYILNCLPTKFMDCLKGTFISSECLPNYLNYLGIR